MIGMARTIRRAAVLAAALVAAGADGVQSRGLDVADKAGAYRVTVRTFLDMKFNRTVRQEADFSCGAAAIATLLTYHYGAPTGEREVMEAMLARGDAARIAREGFSLAHMQDYLASRGYRAGGFQAPLETLAKAGVPGIVLVNADGYMHFVVVKGLSDHHVLVGDPALGAKILPREEFERMWTGVLFVIVNHDGQGRRYFNHPEEWASWTVRPKTFTHDGTQLREDLASFLLTMSRPATSFFVSQGGPNILQQLF